MFYLIYFLSFSKFSFSSSQFGQNIHYFASFIAII